MGTRLQRVEALLVREIAGVVLFGKLRDPRLQPLSGISITGVKVSADLSSARVYVDVLSEELVLSQVIAGLNAGAGAVRAALGGRVRMKRIPALRFLHDEAIARGARIEEILHQLGSEGGSSSGDDVGE